jgi:hypothetical protein
MEGEQTVFWCIFEASPLIPVVYGRAYGIVTPCKSWVYGQRGKMEIAG